MITGALSLLAWFGGTAHAIDAAAADAFQVGGCTLCHAVPDVPAASRQDSCVACHAWIRAVADDPDRSAKAAQVFPLWPRYARNTRSYLQVPDLSSAMARLEPQWVRSWLQDPHDTRPMMPEGMPRFQLDDAQLDAITGAFAAAQVASPPTPPPEPARVDDGARLFETRGCLACHAFGARTPTPGTPTAPDLAHTRARMSPDAVAAWIRDPSAVSASATMPSLGLSDEDVLALRDYVLLGDASAPPAVAHVTLPPPADQAVAWADVEERVFGRICVHCHMDPAQNQGRAGPGNAGGFGFAATGIELQTIDGVRAAAALIPDALLRRRQEAHRDVVPVGYAPAALTRPERPGMPLGLPPIDDPDTALVLAWIAQGMPE